MLHLLSVYGISSNFAPQPNLKIARKPTLYVFFLFNLQTSVVNLWLLADSAL